MRNRPILATKYAGEVLADPFGYPLRLRASTKLGYKNAKWIKTIEVTNDFHELHRAITQGGRASVVATR
jgi:DMSO/TMAO reductase YedYZ molybdopterin-dependent catalytic subunit